MLKGCLIGCLSVIGVIIILIAIIGVLLVYKGDDLKNGFLDQVEAGIPYILTDDHTVLERDAFLQSFSLFVADLRENDIRTALERNSDLIIELQSMLEDRAITPEESKKWIATYQGNM